MRIVSYGLQKGCGHEQDGETLKGFALCGQRPAILPMAGPSR
jgi:hypothetical protein